MRRADAERLLNGIGCGRWLGLVLRHTFHPQAAKQSSLFGWSKLKHV